MVCLFFTALINSGAAKAVLAEGSELGGTVCIADGGDGFYTIQLPICGIKSQNHGIFKAGKDL